MLFKKLLAITIAYSFMLQLGSQFGAWVNYMANTEYALSHCENKASKTMNCYGNCVLVKEIKSLEKNQSKDNHLQIKVKEFQLFGPSTFELQYFINHIPKNYVVPYLTKISNNFFLSIFHPPD
jgi:hypothetical protein